MLVISTTLSLSESQINETKLILLLTVLSVFIKKFNEIQILNYHNFEPFEGF